jgi:2-keto-3-deoxy-L-rhamnonate aldolase RhmA
VYLGRNEDELLIMCQVDYMEGVKNMGEIMAVNDVDYIHMDIRPHDLSASWGTRR